MDQFKYLGGPKMVHGPALDLEGRQAILLPSHMITYDELGINTITNSD